MSWQDELGCTCPRGKPSSPTKPGSRIQVGHAAGCPAIERLYLSEREEPTELGWVDGPFYCQLMTVGRDPGPGLARKATLDDIRKALEAHGYAVVRKAPR